jgi:hypothetical protein
LCWWVQVTPKGPNRRASTPSSAPTHPVGGRGDIGSHHNLVHCHHDGADAAAHGVRAGASAAAGWLAFNLVLVAAAIARIRSIRYGAERPASVRFPVTLPARLDGTACTATDLWMTGARISSPPRCLKKRRS